MGGRRVSYAPRTREGDGATHKIHAFMMMTLLLRKIQMQMIGAGSAAKVSDARGRQGKNEQNSRILGAACDKRAHESAPSSRDTEGV